MDSVAAVSASTYEQMFVSEPLDTIPVPKRRGEGGKDRRGGRRCRKRGIKRNRDRLVQSFWNSSTRRFSRRGRRGGKERSGEQRRLNRRFSGRGERRREPGRRNSPKSPTQEKYSFPTSVHRRWIQPVHHPQHNLTSILEEDEAGHGPQIKPA